MRSILESFIALSLVEADEPSKFPAISPRRKAVVRSLMSDLEKLLIATDDRGPEVRSEFIDTLVSRLASIGVSVDVRDSTKKEHQSMSFNGPSRSIIGAFANTNRVGSGPSDQSSRVKEIDIEIDGRWIKHLFRLKGSYEIAWKLHQLESDLLSDIAHEETHLWQRMHVDPDAKIVPRTIETYGWDGYIRDTQEIPAWGQTIAQEMLAAGFDRITSNSLRASRWFDQIESGARGQKDWPNLRRRLLKYVHKALEASKGW